MSAVILEAEAPALREARAAHQDALANAEQEYSDALRELGMVERANVVAGRATSHRELAARIRGGAT